MRTWHGPVRSPPVGAIRPPRSARADAMLYDALVQPFIEFGFMRRALVACLALSISAGPIGVFLVLRRMSLMGDAMSHAILPGAALGFLAFGLSMWAMSLGGLVVEIGRASCRERV